MATFFGDPGFMPHIHCYLSKAPLVWTMVTTDVVIGTAYLAISTLLWLLIRRVRIPFSPVVLAFGLFIFACGLTHYLEVWTLWKPDYWFSAGVKAVTALASVGTGVYLFELRQPIVEVAESARLSEKRRIDLEELNSTLTQRVEERTRALAEREAEFRAFFDNAAVGMAQVDLTTGRYHRANACFLRMLGYSLDELRSVRPEDITHPGDRDADVANYESLRSGDRDSFFSEKRYLRKDGGELWVSLSASVVRDAAGKPVRTVSVAQDITDRRAAERERARLQERTNTDVENLRRAEERLARAVRSRDEFLSIASHELRTPLTSLRTQSQLLARGLERGESNEVVTDRMRRLALMTDRQTQKLSRLVDDMLDIARLSTGRMSMSREPSDLAAVVRETVERLREELEAETASVSISTPEELAISCDRIRIEQVVTNLLTNAMRYGEHGPVEVELVRRNDLALLTVRDHGIGVATSDRERIFERFERAIPAAQVSGLGLGLYIARGIVTAHSGSIRVEDTPGGGATFVVELPLEPTPPA